MNRFYMTAATRQTLIVESNRLIAARASANAARRRGEGERVGGHETGDGARAASQDDVELAAVDADDAFAKVVADLQGTSVRSEPS